MRDLRKTNEILKLATPFFAQAELDRHHKAVRRNMLELGFPAWG